MKVFEVQDALSVKVGQDQPRTQHRPSRDMILACCQGLVSIDPESEDIRIAHFAIQEYLLEHSEELFVRPEAFIAEICLTYLLFSTFREGPCQAEHAIRSRLQSHNLLNYAAVYWGVHGRSAESDPMVQQLTHAFLRSPGAIASANQILAYSRSYREEYWDAEECSSVTALHVAGQFGLVRAFTATLDEKSLSVDTPTKMGTTPLIKAASSGHVSICQMLLQRGASPYLENWYGNALHCAAEAGKCEVISLLIHFGMSPNICPRYAKSPLQCTFDNDHAAAFATLVKFGANIESEKTHSVTILHAAAMWGTNDILDLILERRWAELEGRTEEGQTAMHYAAEGDDASILLQLLEAGADVNAQDDMGSTPLEYALEHENKQNVKLLLDYGGKAGSS